MEAIDILHKHASTWGGKAMLAQASQNVVELQVYVGMMHRVGEVCNQILKNPAAYFTYADLQAFMADLEASVQGTGSLYQRLLFAQTLIALQKDVIVELSAEEGEE